MDQSSRSKFSGKLGYVLAVAGSAVGLGNIWRFPYLAAKYGGGIFLLVYIVLTVSFGYALIMSESALPVNSFFPLNFVHIPATRLYRSLN